MKLDGSILVPLAEGFEEIEAITVIDVLRRAELPVIVASLGELEVTGSHGIPVRADRRLDEVGQGEVGMIVLPGGIPGTHHLRDDPRVLEWIRELHAAGRPTAAICAAPLVLAEAGILENAEATSHPAVRDQLGPATVLTEPRVVRSGTIVTSQGAGTAMEFALALVADLCGPERARGLGEAMLVRTEVSTA